MGKGLAFLNLKFFHPGNRENQRRKWEALQKEAERQRKIKERQLELNQEKQAHDTRKMLFEQELGADSVEYRKESKREQLGFLYNEPPGLKKSLEAERKKIEEAERLKEWQDAMSQMTREERRFAEKEMETGLSVHERNVRRFECLKNAPMEADYVKNMEVTHKPFGKVIRNVRCIKCGKWGHRIYDRECEMNDHYDPLKDALKDKEEGGDKEKEENKEDPLYNMNAKLLSKHLRRYQETHGADDDSMSCINTVIGGDGVKSEKMKYSLVDTQSVFTLNPDEKSLNAKMFHVKSFEGNDGTKFELLEEEQEQNKNQTVGIIKEEQSIKTEMDGTDGMNGKRKKKKSRKRKRNGDGSDDEEDYKYILSLPKEKQMKLLKEIEKRERKRRKSKRKKKKSKKERNSKRNMYSSDDSENEMERRHRIRKRSRSRSRSRSKDDYRGKRRDKSHKSKSKSHRRRRSRSRSASRSDSEYGYRSRRR